MTGGTLRMTSGTLRMTWNVLYKFKIIAAFLVVQHLRTIGDGPMSRVNLGEESVSILDDGVHMSHDKTVC